MRMRSHFPQSPELFFMLKFNLFDVIRVRHHMNINTHDLPFSEIILILISSSSTWHDIVDKHNKRYSIICLCVNTTHSLTCLRCVCRWCLILWKTHTHALRLCGLWKLRHNTQLLHRQTYNENTYLCFCKIKITKISMKFKRGLQCGAFFLLSLVRKSFLAYAHAAP